ncbi:MAG TPA: hypothetical protein VGX23_20340 [Actinocrinis sp.]|nr:hypothetical protein [Actinocrinis sp.]
MARELSYADAVKLLGGTDSRVVAALDRLTGGLLLTATGGGSVLALNLFDAEGEFAKLSGEEVLLRRLAADFLYERLLVSFVEREVRKSRPELAGEPLAAYCANLLLLIVLSGGRRSRPALRRVPARGQRHVLQVPPARGSSGEHRAASLLGGRSLRRSR